jgi:hypothetical protein
MAYAQIFETSLGKSKYDNEEREAMRGFNSGYHRSKE